MKTKICSALLALTALVGVVPAHAIGLSINLNPNDRPYYTHGPSYFNHGVRYVWVAGHVNRRGAWVPGHYKPV